MFSVTRRKLHELYLHANNDKKVNVLNYVLNIVIKTKNPSVKIAVNKFLNTHFYPNYLKRWKLVNRSNERFLEKFKEWLNGNINISSDLFGSDPIASTSGNI